MLAEFLEMVRTGLVPRGSYLLVESQDRISRQAARKVETILKKRGILIAASSSRALTEPLPSPSAWAGRASR
jgi:DNA invertase Pin-like site-specific DNA recombinase